MKQNTYTTTNTQAANGEASRNAERIQSGPLFPPEGGREVKQVTEWEDNGDGETPLVEAL